jgi:hypothetical protein
METRQCCATTFEVVNKTLNEIFVGIFIEPTTLDDIRYLHKRLPPKSISHWQEGQDISYSLVAENMNGDDALAFLRVYAAKIEDPVWTVFSE